MKTAFFRDVTTCSLLGTYQRYGRTCSLHLQDTEDDSSTVATLHSNLKANILFVFSHWYDQEIFTSNKQQLIIKRNAMYRLHHVACFYSPALAIKSSQTSRSHAPIQPWSRMIQTHICVVLFKKINHITRAISSYRREVDRCFRTTYRPTFKGPRRTQFLHHTRPHNRNILCELNNKPSHIILWAEAVI